MRLDPVHFSMLVIGVSFACYAPSLNSLQDQAYRSAVVIEGEVRSSPENVSRDPYSVNVKVLDVWPVNSGGLEREQLVTVGDFGSEAPCTTVEENHRYIFFMDPTGEPLVFKASFAPLDASGTDLKKDVESVLCEDCAAAPKLRPMRGQSLMEGERLYLKCEASGNPSPSFQWYKDGRELQRGKDVKIKTNKKNSKVQINRARLEDSGNYTCVVENTLGQENATSGISVQSLTTTLSPGSSHARRCNDTEKSYCVNGGDCYFIHGINQRECQCPNDYTGDRCQKSVMAGFYKHLGIEFMEAEELYQRRVLTITGICVALLVVGMVCVVAYCKTKKQRKKMHGHLNQSVNQNQCVEEPNRMLANGPNHPGPGPEEIPMVDYISKNAPTTECSIIQHGPEESVNFAGSRMSTRSHHSSTVSHNSRHEERTWSIERTDSMNSDFQSGALSSSVGTSKCSSPTCMEARARRAVYWGCSEGASLQYGDSYDSLRDSPHSDRYVSALTTPARLSPVQFHYPPLSPQVPTFHITSPNTGHALALPPATAAYHREDDQPLLRCPQDGLLYRPPRRPRQPYLTESTGSLPSSPYRLPDDEAYETTQEYASSREPIRSRRRPRRNRLNGHFSQHAMGLRDYSSQSFSQSEEEEEEEGHGESTPFLSMQNMNMEPCERGCRSSTAPGTTTDIRTHRAQGRPSPRSNGHSKFPQSRSSKHDNTPL
ncbi:pro-neuregulin-2, membrane-bound isoform-like [Salvelinus sp. IW2-2015]|uniref:pro-neuregulin-2, membrane-bound isoform-like n=1 Tax=Salvelinus sp. IW2-2015 TaxID=2691554 RepID=UPI000CDFB1A5|nr:pro-neuregulin-2, membrane-bound isoform-like [Salvelinus alpinus]